MGLSRTKLAKLAGRSRHTVGLYEADPDAVGEDTRAELDATYDDLQALLAKRRSSSDPPPRAA